MSDIDQIVLSGRLTHDPTLIALADGQSVTHLRIASDTLGRGGETGYINVSTFGPSGEAAARTLTQGWEVLISGRLEHQTWQTEEGERRQSYGIVGEVHFLRAPRGVEVALTATAPGGPGTRFAGVLDSLDGSGTQRRAADAEPAS